MEILQSVPEGFRIIALQGLLSLELLEIITRMWTVLEVLDRARQNTVEPADVAFVNAYKPEHEFHTCIDCLRRISPETRGSLPLNRHTTSIEHVICLGLLAFINGVFGCMTYGRLFKAVQDSLSEAIDNCEPTPAQQDSIIWAQLVSVWAVSITAGPQSEITEETMMNIRRQYGNGLGWEELSDILQSMLWTNDMATACSLAWKRTLWND